MIDLVIDASVAIKWVVEEDGTPEALALLSRAKLHAPDHLLVECANVLWKKGRRREFATGEALFAARLFQTSEIELASAKPLLREATRMAIDLAHPTYDCLYLALALARDASFVTADCRFLQTVRRARTASFQSLRHLAFRGSCQALNALAIAAFTYKGGSMNQRRRLIEYVAWPLKSTKRKLPRAARISRPGTTT